MNCPSCGSTVQPGQRFCDDCGTSVEAIAVASAASIGSEQTRMRSDSGSAAPGAAFADSGTSASTGYGATADFRSLTSKGFISSLFDFGFTSFVTTRVIRAVYVVLMILLGLAALGIAVVLFTVNPVLGIFGLVIIAPLYFFFYLALWRIFLELIIIIFRLADDVRTIRNRAQPSD